MEDNSANVIQKSPTEYCLLGIQISNVFYFSDILLAI